MSFILDALKKSERARQRQAGPSLFEVKIAAPRRAVPAWAVALGVLLVVINAAVIGWIVLRRPVRRAASAVPAASLPSTQVSAASEASRPPAPVRAHSNPGGVPVRAATAPAAASQTSGGAGASAVPARSRPAATAPAANAGSADYAPAIEPSAQDHSDAKLPLYRQLESAPGSALPRLHLDLHVYDSDPSKRFVMINMHQLKQGGALPDGVKVISIRPDGVVLSYGGRRFLLPR